MRPPPNRFSLAILMAFIGVIAVGLGGMRNGSDLVVSIAYAVMLLALSVSLLGSLIRKDGAWIGFALFGWLHAALAFVPAARQLDLPELPTIMLVGEIAKQIHKIPPSLELPINIQWSHPDNSGYSFFKLNEARDAQVPLTSDEISQTEAYQAREEHIRDLDHRIIPNAQRIGSMALTLTFATFGAIVGRLLERPRRLSTDPTPTGA